MKKGEVELKVASGSCGMNDYFIEQINGNPFTIFNLKDLRDLITEELEEEASNHTATCTALQENGMVNDLCCQPLTEGEKKNRDGMRDRATVAKENIARKEKNDLRNRYQPQQESKEECKHQPFRTGLGGVTKDAKAFKCSTCGERLSFSDVEKLNQEPSKKPSERIEEMLENLIGQPAYQSMFVAIVSYLDELHDKGKI